MNLPDALSAHPAPLRADADGVIRVGSSRVTLDTVVGAFRNGCTAEEIVMKYPSLDLTDVGMDDPTVLAWAARFRGGRGSCPEALSCSPLPSQSFPSTCRRFASDWKSFQPR
jgi:hypothetical protein